MKMTMVFERLMLPVNLRSACDSEAPPASHVLIAHLAFDFRLRRERGDRVDHHDVNRARPHQHVGNFQCLLAGIGLRHQQIVDLDPQLLGVHRIERVLGIDKRRGAAMALRRGNDGQRQRGFSRRLRSEDLNHAAARNAAHAERDVEAKGTGGNRIHLVGGAGIAQAHHRALAKLLFGSGSGAASESSLAILFLPWGVLNSVWRYYFIFSAQRSSLYASEM